MELVKLKKDSYILRTTPEEALTLIESLATQINDGDPNVHRHEFSNGKGFEYFSIAVHEPEGIRCDICNEEFDTWSDVHYHKINKHTNKRRKNEAKKRNCSKV